MRLIALICCLAAAGLAGPLGDGTLAAGDSRADEDQRPNGRRSAVEDSYPRAEAPVERGTSGDTITMQAVWTILGKYYNQGNWASRTAHRHLWEQGPDQLECRRDHGYTCFVMNEPHLGRCYPGANCGDWKDPALLLEPLTTAARQHPDAGFVNGQAIYALVKYGREREAAELAGACRAEEWWCEMLIGHVLHAQGRLDEAGSVFRNAVAAAPEEVRCRALDASRLLGRWLGTNPGPGSAVWQRIRDEPCEDKIARSVSLWWLADPLYSTAGNDRWVEHVNRMLLLRLFNDAEGHIRGRAVDRRRYGDHYWSDWLRRGWPDSYVHPGNAWFTSVRAARYHFVPDLEDGDTERPVWRLRAELDDEGYTPRYGTFHELPTQIARFRRTEANPDSMRVAVAGTLSGTEMAGATAEPHLVFSDAPESFPLHLTGEIANDRAAFLTSSPADRYVLSFEVLGDEQFARHRVMLEPLRTEGVGVSDVLLYRPDGGEPPEALEAAADVMLGEAAIGSGEAFGVYWETYGAAEGTSVDIEVDIEGASRGFFSRLRGLLPGGGDDGAVRLAWSEPSPGEVFPRGVVLDPGELEAGGYMLVVRVSWEGREPFELRRGFEVR